MTEEPVGVVVHYFGRPQVAIVRVTAGEIAVGDTLRFMGHGHDFLQQVDSMEVEHRPIERAGAGEEVGIKVAQRVHEKDQVFKATA